MSYRIILINHNGELFEARLKILGIDAGDVRIGVAIGDDLTRLAHPLTIIRHISRNEDACRIIDLALENGCELILVGIPLDSEGGIGPRARSILRLVEEVRNLSSVPVFTWDESGSTKEMDAIQLISRISRKKRRISKDDKVAAFILQDYLEHCSSSSLVNK